jgi:hypothetical protein
MRIAASHRAALLFVGLITLLALYAILLASPGHMWALDYLSGLVAAITAMAICARLSLVIPNATARHYWIAVLVLFVLVSLGQFAEPLVDGHRISAWMSYLLLAISLVMPAMTARFDPIPRGTMRALWLGIWLQLGGIWATQLGESRDVIIGPVGWSEIADLAPLLALQCYLVGAILFVAYLRRQMFVVGRRPQDVGDVARYLFATSHLFHKQRYPRADRSSIPGGSLGLGIARFFVWYFKLAPRVRDRFKRGLLLQFCDLCAIGFRHGLDAKAYYMFELYRSERRARASGVMTRYETKNGIIKVLNRQLPKYGKRTPLGDKLAMAELCAENDIAHVATLIHAENGKLILRDARENALEQDLFLKPRQLKGARDTEIVRFAAGGFVLADGTRLSRQALLDHIAERSNEAPLLVQPRLVNHPDLADLAEHSLLPVRVITCLDRTEKPVVTHAFLRVLCKLESSWQTDVELGAPIDLETGQLGLMTGDKLEMAFDWHAQHPVTGARVLGRRLPYLADVLSIALAAHALAPDRLLIGWDIAVAPNGAYILEGNSYPDVDFPQRVFRCGIGDSPLGPLLFDRIVDVERRIDNGTLRRGGGTD